MSTVAELFGVNKIVGAVVGLELEVEGTRLPVEIEGWRTERDGSLRDGLEYVMATPSGALKTKELLEKVQEAFAANKTKTSYSFRTSTHCHINVSNLDIEQVKVILVLYYLFENQYSQYCAKGRAGNRFCLRLSDAEYINRHIRQFITTNRLPAKDEGKYCAMNMVPLSSYGTLEVRTLEGTDNWEKVYLWVRALIRLRKVGKEIGTLAALKQKNIQELADLLFGTPLLSRAFLKEGWEAEVTYQQSLMLDILN